MSGNDIIFNLKDQISNVVTSKMQHVKVRARGRQVSMKEDQAFERPRHIKRAEFNPVVSSVINFGVSPTITEFRVYEQSDFETCDWITLRGQITRIGDALTNNGGTGTAGSNLSDPSPLWVDKIEILTGGSTSVLQTIYGDQLWYSLSTLPSEKLATFLQNNMMYMGADFKVNNNLYRRISGSSVLQEEWRTRGADGTPKTNFSRPFVIPILSCLLDKFRLRALSGDTIIRVYWQRQIASVYSVTAFGTTPVLTAASLTPSDAASNSFFLSGLQLVLETEEILERDKMAYENMLKQGPLLIKFVEPIVQTFTQTVSNTTPNQFQLTAIYGDIAFLQVYLRKATGEPQTALRAIAPEATFEASDLGTAIGTTFQIQNDYQDADWGASFQITDSSSKQLFSPNGFKVFDVRYAHHSKTLPNTFCNSNAMYLIPFCESPAAAIQDGAIDGYANFTASEYLRFTTSSTFVSGTYKVTVVAWKVKHAQIDRKMAILL